MVISDATLTPREREQVVTAAMLGIVPCREGNGCNGCIVDGVRAEHRRTDLFRRYERERREGNLTFNAHRWAQPSDTWTVRHAAADLGIVPFWAHLENGSTRFAAARRHNAERAAFWAFMARTGRILMGWDD